jgi:hypothetical protein
MIANAGCGSSCLPEQQEIVRLPDAPFEVIERNEREIDAALQRSERRLPRPNAKPVLSP